MLPFMENVTRGRGIGAERLAEVSAHYERLGGVSPINAQNRALIEALRPLVDLPIFWGNRNWKPFLIDAVSEMADAGVTHCLAFITSAFSSYSGCRQYLDELAAARATIGDRAPTIERLPPFFTDPGFIEPLRDNLGAARRNAPTGSRIVFTAHSIPLAMASASRYESELRTACALVAGDEPWDLVFQSRSGPPTVPWLEPDINDHLRDLHTQATKGVVVVPIGFVSDHIEVMWDLDTQARETADTLGLSFARAATVGTDPRFVAMIAAKVRDSVSGARPSYACAADCCPAPPSSGRLAVSSPPSGARPVSGGEEAPATGRPTRPE